VGSSVAVSSGTAAIHLSLLALAIGKGDEVIIPSYVCTALLNAVRYVCATPVLADINPATFNMDVADARKKITPRTKAVILPHMFGLPADIDEFLSLKIPIIEDCAMSLGGGYKDALTGSFGTLSVFSFYATKMIATGEGGMVLSRRSDLIDRIRDLRDYDEKPDDIIRYNYKMTDLQAALGVSQLKKLPAFIHRRRQIAGLYNICAKALGVASPSDLEERDYIYYRYVILVDQPDEFIAGMKKCGIDCRKPVFRPLHRYLGLTGFPSTDKVWERAVSIPLYPSLTDDEAFNITEHMKSLLQG
jgi:dTDP-4-amino-4,6-dideoxygalactose transaminase